MTVTRLKGKQRHGLDHRDDEPGMHHTMVARQTPSRWTRENAAVGIALLVVTALAWAYTLHLSSMHGMPMPGGVDGGGADGSSRTLISAVDLLVFMFGWAVMMVAMMLPAALPLVLLYRAIARKRRSSPEAACGVAALLAGYVAVWTVAGIPVYFYGLLVAELGRMLTLLPGLLLITAGLYQFTSLKQACRTRCSGPQFFLTRHWRPGLFGAGRLGVLHGLDCVGCCVGLMLALVALGMMNVAWMLTAAVIILVEKTLPAGNRVAPALGVALIVGGLAVIGGAMFGNA